MILGGDDGFLQGRRDGGERSPREASPVRVDAKLVDRLAVAVEQLRIRRAPSRAYRVEAWHGRPAKGDRCQQPHHRGERSR